MKPVKILVFMGFLSFTAGLAAVFFNLEFNKYMALITYGTVCLLLASVLDLN